MIRSKRLSNSQIAQIAKCSERTVTELRRKLRLSGTARPHLVRAGRPPSITPLMLDALCDHLVEKPGLYIEAMAVFLWDQFRVLPSTSSIQRALSLHGWTKKQAREKAKEQNPQLRAFYQHKLSKYRSDQFVFVDESGCDKRVGFRRTGWSPLGVTPVQISQFHRGQRYHILPAYAQDGIIISDIYQGSIDGTVFESFIQRLLQHCRRFAEPRSVIAMDNASFHRSERVQQLCADAGVKSVYLPPYSPDFNPIEEFFAELKAYIKKAWSTFAENPGQGFHSFLRKCVQTVGEREKSAEGHFRHAGITLGRPASFHRSGYLRE